MQHVIVSTWLLAGLMVGPLPGWQPLDQHTATCPSLDAYFLDDYDSDADGRADIRLMGRLRVDGTRDRAMVRMVMDNDQRMGSAVVQLRADDDLREMTSMEFFGRWRSPCHVLGPRGPANP